MKKILVVLLVILLVSVSGCGNTEKKDPVPTKTTKNKIETDKDKKNSQTKDKSTDSQNQDKVKPQTENTTEKESDSSWTPITIEQAPEGYNCEFCLGCGKTSDQIEITKWGYCSPCYNIFRPFGDCAVCGNPLDGSDKNHYDGTRCYACASRCDYCQMEITEDMFVWHGYVDALCYARYIVGCVSCGSKNDTVDASTGLCYDCMKRNGAYENCPVCGTEYRNTGDGMCSSCYEASISPPENFGTEPNVWCPNCGYGWFTTGVGIDGFYCSQCGYNWLPEY